MVQLFSQPNPESSGFIINSTTGWVGWADKINNVIKRIAKVVKLPMKDFDLVGTLFMVEYYFHYQWEQSRIEIIILGKHKCWYYIYNNLCNLRLL